ncbi:hypothetical protein [Glaciecola petra]|uniref:PEP-CTERM protein-sorting domain-containing protein n=1 Tax=Glaciecola petra TaxID=3075602 RepID=A0ABU2ZNC0_9ALTE|nr:hypothetical protein [Aestuariibacter sp. P117]MDT0593756.1 hypothetical protein [Aestuariibacter sp. P117]
MKPYLYVVACISLFVSLTANAAFIANPDPSTLADDIDGTGYFAADNILFSTEILDIGEAILNNGNIFGFYFEGSDVLDANNRHVIFGSDDGDNSEAVVNFANGIVVDVDQGVVQNSFSGTGNIGFFVQLSAFGNGLLFSDASLNAGNIDYFGAFERNASPGTFALLFADPTNQDLIELVVSGTLAPVDASSPSLFALLMIGMFSILKRRK